MPAPLSSTATPQLGLRGRRGSARRPRRVTHPTPHPRGTQGRRARSRWRCDLVGGGQRPTEKRTCAGILKRHRPMAWSRSAPGHLIGMARGARRGRPRRRRARRQVVGVQTRKAMLSDWAGAALDGVTARVGVMASSPVSIRSRMARRCALRSRSRAAGEAAAPGDDADEVLCPRAPIPSGWRH